MLIALGVGIFYFLNGGWKTPTQQQKYFTHTYIPAMRIMQGDKRAWAKENARRQKEGLPPLPRPNSDSDPL